MSSPAVQLSFTLRTSPNVKTVHLLGSWDNYKSQLPLSQLKDAKPGSWRGAFRFQGSHALKLGSRYWYYYIVDGYHVSHDPAKEFTTEPTTGRKLNILDVPSGKNSAASHSDPPSSLSSNNRHSREIPKGRPLSPGRIQHPKPSKPYASRQLREADYSTSPVDDLAGRFEGTRITDHDYEKYNSTPSSISSRSSSSDDSVFDSRSSPSSLSSASSGSECRCERYGITRSGQRVKLDCGGSRCGSSESSGSDCSSESSESEEEVYRRSVHKAVEKKPPAKSSAKPPAKSSAKPPAKPTTTKVAVSRRR